MMSPFEVVAATSIVTNGTSTEMETPPEGGGCCCPVGFCGFCDGGGFCCGCWPVCGPVGACAAAGVWLSAINKLADSSAAAILFMPSPVLVENRKNELRNAPRQWSLGNSIASQQPKHLFLHVSMKHFPGKTVVTRKFRYSDQGGSLVIGKQKFWMVVFALGLAIIVEINWGANNLQAQGLPVAPQPSPQSVPSTTALSQEALGWLTDLIRINTSNPPGNEEAAAKYIATLLQKEGISSEIVPLTPGRSALIARLRATAIADPSRALLLVAHMDVVGVDRPRWTVDPFGGVLKDGYLYGRGAVDDKGMLAANLAAFISLKRANARLNRDVIFLATCDEEAFGDSSVKILIAKNWDKFAAGFAINEGGVVIAKDGKVQYTAIQASEKVTYNVDVVARGTSGHASIPLKDNPVVHLAAAIEKIANYSAPVHYTAVTRRYFEGIAPLQDDDLGKWIRSLDTADRGEHAAR